MDLKIDKYIEERKIEFKRLKKLNKEKSLRIKLLKQLISKFTKLE